MALKLISGGKAPDVHEEQPIVLERPEPVPEETEYRPRAPRFPPGFLSTRDRLIELFTGRNHPLWRGAPSLEISDSWKDVNIQGIIAAAEFVPFAHPSFEGDHLKACAAYADFDFVTPLRAEFKVPVGGKIFADAPIPALSIERSGEDKFRLTFGHMMNVGGEWRITNLRHLIGGAVNTIAASPVTYFKELR